MTNRKNARLAMICLMPLPVGVKAQEDLWGKEAIITQYIITVRVECADILPETLVQKIRLVDCHVCPCRWTHHEQKNHDGQ
ncbi:MAG: hypothetical protein IJ587_10445 [Synergistaceae bacterium]|nr:hypothetical protein [Synergistaceae bacterium]